MLFISPEIRIVCLVFRLMLGRRHHETPRNYGKARKNHLLREICELPLHTDQVSAVHPRADETAKHDVIVSIHHFWGQLAN